MRLPENVYNPISLIGAGLAIVMFFAIVVFLLTSYLAGDVSPYLGILTFMIFPAIMVAGLLLIPTGMLLERRRKQRLGLEKRRYITIDLNKPQHRLAFMIFTVGTMVLVVISAAGTYEAYHYTESVEFCGEICHSVMHPEYIAYQHSPHARVACAACHIGSGADWFVKAKISGAHQVIAVNLNTYERPIPTPIENLRPARETCEQCHWPQKFSGEMKLQKTYFPLDTTETVPWTIYMDLKVGGGRTLGQPTAGIHWHMDPDVNVHFIAMDKKRQDIPWISSVGRDGKEKIFRRADFQPTDTEFSAMEQRKMDCLDCHNRPSHIYHPPFHSLNYAMEIGRIDPSLPNIRGIASHALTVDYQTTAEAMQRIPDIIRNEYRDTAPEVLTRQRVAVDSSISEVLRIYKRNFFPEMKVNWKAYPDNRGHMYDDGCFRCHDNEHVTEDGEVLTNDCTLCHSIIAQGPTGNMESKVEGLEFRHPSDIGGLWRDMRCTECHAGE